MKIIYYKEPFTEQEFEVNKTISDYFTRFENNLQNIADSRTRDEMQYCMYEMLDGSFTFYLTAANLAKKLNIKRVYDVGANLGIQRIFFEELDIEYIPIEPCIIRWHEDALKGLINQFYPLKIETTKTDMLISNLCISFLDDFGESLKQIKEDFTNSFINMSGSSYEEHSSYLLDNFNLNFYQKHEINEQWFGFLLLTKKEED